MTPKKPFITPRDAESMLREATPGPWQARGDGPSAGQPHFYICTCEDRTHVAENVYYGNARLLTYAPDLAAIVAGLRVEYAVRDSRGSWFNWRSGTWTKDSDRASWMDFDRASDVSEFSPWDTRVVARYVTTNPWEVEA